MPEKRIQLIVDKNFHAMVKLKALKEQKTVTQVVMEMLQKWLKKG